MKKIDKAAWLVSACMLAAAAAALFFLPDELAIQWNNSGISNTGPKWIVLLFPALAALCIVLHANQTGKKKEPGIFPGILQVSWSCLPPKLSSSAMGLG